MTTDNVIAFQLRRPSRVARIERDDDGNLVPVYDETASPFVHVELRLRPNCTLQLNAVDDRGDVVTFEYALAAPATAVDLERLVSAWNLWRNASTVAS